MTGGPQGFAARLRQATTPDHQQAESSSFLDRLLAGELDLTAYRLLTVQHLAIYQALEAGAEALRRDPVVAVLHDPALERLPSLQADLAWLRGQDRRRPDAQADRPVDEVLPATRRYAERITEVAAMWPGGFVAHHYTRYLGDLSGGLYIGRVLARQLGGGTAFYRFDAIADPRRFKQDYRAALDAAPWDDQEQASIVAEVSRAYALNRSVLAALAVRTEPSLPAADRRGPVNGDNRVQRLAPGRP